MVVLKEAEKLKKFIDDIEDMVIDYAEDKGVKIRIERDFRGRWATIAIRAVKREGKGERMVLYRKLNGRKVK